MNDLMTVRRKYRLQLLATASAWVLLGSAASAEGTDAARPPVWIELGWQFEKIQGTGAPFDPSFFNQVSQAGFDSPQDSQRKLSWSSGAEGVISIQPAQSDWIFSAALRYGRAQGHAQTHQQTVPQLPSTIPVSVQPYFWKPFNANYSDLRASNAESHLILDFKAGRDVGLGIVDGTISIGVRFAQFQTKSTTNDLSDLNFQFYHGPYLASCHCYFDLQRYDNYAFSGELARSFHGLGPSISWNASPPIVGNENAGKLTLDWGFNAALLFGRQKADTHHRTSESSFRAKYFASHYPNERRIQDYDNAPPAAHRARSVVVPNLGGFVGISLRYPNAKVSLGYRGDFFFGAMDEGVDSRKTHGQNFHGPFATISIGLGG